MAEGPWGMMNEPQGLTDTLLTCSACRWDVINGRERRQSRQTCDLRRMLLEFYPTHRDESIQSVTSENDGWRSCVSVMHAYMHTLIPAPVCCVRLSEALALPLSLSLQGATTPDNAVHFRT